MSSKFKDQVDLLFKNAPDRHYEIRENPVTGESFVPGLDPIKPHKERAVRALEAQERFAAEKSPDMPDLPVNKQTDDPASFRWLSGLHYLIEAYTHSLRIRDYRPEGHPDFKTFARGAMADPQMPERFRNDPDLLARFPSKRLPGLGRGLAFKCR